MKSPCIQVCKIEDGKCLGCRRTLDQIRDWPSYTDQKREEIMDDIIEPDYTNSSIETKQDMMLRKTVYTVTMLGHTRTTMVDDIPDSSHTSHKAVDEIFDEIKEWRKYITGIKYLD